MLVLELDTACHARLEFGFSRRRAASADVPSAIKPPTRCQAIPPNLIFFVYKRFFLLSLQAQDNRVFDCL